MKWQSQAPANTMILGEHSVVYGHPAIACALDQFIRIDWRARSDHAIHITSTLATHSTDLETLSVHPQLTFVGHALLAFQDQLSFGLDIHIHSDFSSTIGLGSSAAVLAAMLNGLTHITKQHHSALALFEIGHAIILKIQGRGSGTDLAASLTGGVIYFQPGLSKTATKILKLRQGFALTLIYTGYKTPTAEVLALVAKQWQSRPEQLAALYHQMGNCTQTAFNALQNQDMPGFYNSITHYQSLMDQLGVNDPTLSQLINALNACKSIHAAKISGSGLGDCVIGIGTLKACSEHTLARLKNYQRLEVTITPFGASTQLIEQAPEPSFPPLS